MCQLQPEQPKATWVCKIFLARFGPLRGTKSCSSCRVRHLPSSQLIPHISSGKPVIRNLHLYVCICTAVWICTYIGNFQKLPETCLWGPLFDLQLCPYLTYNKMTFDRAMRRMSPTYCKKPQFSKSLSLWEISGRVRHGRTYGRTLLRIRMDGSVRLSQVNVLDFARSDFLAAKGLYSMKIRELQTARRGGIKTVMKRRMRRIELKCALWIWENFECVFLQQWRRVIKYLWIY